MGGARDRDDLLDRVYARLTRRGPPERTRHALLRELLRMDDEELRALCQELAAGGSLPEP